MQCIEWIVKETLPFNLQHLIGIGQSMTKGGRWRPDLLVPFLAGQPKSRQNF
jgi:hypothetical protein